MSKNLYPIGFLRFNAHLVQLDDILKEVQSSKDPALAFYQSKARTYLFYLEALCRLYKEIGNQKIFSKLGKRFKALEDLLGEIDYYDGFLLEFRKKKGFPKTVLENIERNKSNKLKELLELLVKGEWLTEDRLRILKIFRKLDKVAWLPNKEDAIELKKIYATEVSEVIKYIQSDECNFDDVEKDVHELRRKLRWLSIYPPACRGLFLLESENKIIPALKKYFTSNVINSPYNVFPSISNQNNVIRLNKNYFYALSWLIAELGELKDRGLGLIIVEESLKQINSTSKAGKVQQVQDILGKNYISTRQILNNAKGIVSAFMKEKNLEHLIF